MSACFDTICTRVGLSSAKKIHSCIPENQNRAEKETMREKKLIHLEEENKTGRSQTEMCVFTKLSFIVKLQWEKHRYES